MAWWLGTPGSVSCVSAARSSAGFLVRVSCLGGGIQLVDPSGHRRRDIWTAQRSGSGRASGGLPLVCAVTRRPTKPAAGLVKGSMRARLVRRPPPILTLPNPLSGQMAFLNLKIRTRLDLGLLSSVVWSVLACLANRGSII